MDALQRGLLSGMVLSLHLSQDKELWHTYRTPAVRHTRSFLKVPPDIQKWAAAKNTRTPYNTNDVRPIERPPHAQRWHHELHGVPLSPSENMWASFRHVEFHTDTASSDTHAFVMWCADIPAGTTFVLGQHSYAVKSGDVFVFDAVIPHAWIPPNDEDGHPLSSIAFLGCTPWSADLCRTLGVHTMSNSKELRAQVRLGYHERLSKKLDVETGLCGP